MLTEKKVNLWGLLVAEGSHQYCHEGLNEGHTLIKALHGSSRFSGQEIELEAEADGWRVTVASCYENGGAIELFIPADPARGVELQMKGE